jgi:hypothetical protein
VSAMAFTRSGEFEPALTSRTPNAAIWVAVGMEGRTLEIYEITAANSTRIFSDCGLLSESVVCRRRSISPGDISSKWYYH